MIVIHEWHLPTASVNWNRQMTCIWKPKILKNVVNSYQIDLGSKVKKKKVNPMVLRRWVATTDRPGTKSLVARSLNVRLYLLCTHWKASCCPPPQPASQPVSRLVYSPLSLRPDPSGVLGGVTWSRAAPRSILAGLLACSTGGRVSRLRPRHPSSPRLPAPPSS